MTAPPSKESLRAELRQALRAVPADRRHTESRAVCERLAASPRVSAARRLLVYLAMPNEVDLDPFITARLAANIAIGAPRVDWDQAQMTVGALTNLANGVAHGRHGVREPAPGPAIPLDSFDLAIIPGLAFDPVGARLGRGGGFYDRFLAGLRRVSTVPVLGVAFDEQIVPRVPMEGHDVAVDAIATPTRWLGPDAARFTG